VLVHITTLTGYIKKCAFTNLNRIRRIKPILANVYDGEGGACERVIECVSQTTGFSLNMRLIKFIPVNYYLFTS